MKTAWAVVVAQLVERSLPTSKILGLNPDIGKILSTNCTIEKIKIRKKKLAHRVEILKLLTLSVCLRGILNL